MHFLKRAMKRVLRRLDRRVVYIRRDQPSGVDLGHDLRVIIPEAHPICLDVGANAGEFVDLFAHALDRPTVHAFEPSSAMFRLLQLRRFGDGVTLHHYGMGQRLATADLTNYEAPWMNSTLPLDPGESNRYRRAKSTASEPVEIKTVDWFLAEHIIEHVDILKVDTQGTELDVLKGAAESLRRGAIRTVFVELMFEPLYIGQGAPREIVDLMAEHGLFLVDYYDKVRRDHRLARCNALFLKGRGSVIGDV